ncbi:50S ribosomal protein L21 [bacterium]|nr:50S ribosomal protein L21 [bacterium]
MFAVIETGGKQYKVTEGETVLVDLIDIPEKETKVVFDKVLLIESDKKTSIGQPTVENATVEAEFISVEKGKKIHVFKMKRRKNSKKKIGHRQKYSMVKIIKINESAANQKKTEPKKADDAPVGVPVKEIKKAEVPVDKPKIKKPAEPKAEKSIKNDEGKKAVTPKEDRKETPSASDKNNEDNTK